MNPKEWAEYIKEKEPNICQITVRQNGEEVYSGEWNGYKRDDCVHVMSVTKSIMALLTGIALDRGMIGSPDDKVLSFFRHMKYGFLWWIMDEHKPIYAAIGNSGNVIYIDESEHLTVAITSFFKPTVPDRIDFIENTLKKELLHL